jgi:hypothetical protein
MRMDTKMEGREKSRDLCWNRDTVTVEVGSISAGLWSLAQLSLDGTVTNGYCGTSYGPCLLLSANTRLKSREVLTHFTLTARNIMRRFFPHCHTSAFCGTCSTLHYVRFITPNERICAIDD